MTSHIIGISGNMGAGKTTLARAIAKDLRASLICWDDFDDISQGPEDYVAWYKKGQDYTQWHYQALADVLQALQSSQSTLHPALQTMLHPTDYIIFDAPLGRLHTQTGRFIDTCVHLEVPLDVSLGRHLLRDFKTPHKTKEELLEEIEFYLSESRPLFFDENLKQSADLIVDGMLLTESQVQLVKQNLKRK